MGENLDRLLVDRYLQLESLLNEFCRVFDYCYPFCIKNELEREEMAVGCCKNKYYKKYDLDHPSFRLLAKEREELYGKPEKYGSIHTPSPCEYHSPEGCVLKTHKSPICNAFFCPESIELLRSKYDIFNYDYLGVYYALEWTLDGTFTDAQYNEFCSDISFMIKRIKTVKNI